MPRVRMLTTVAGQSRTWRAGAVVDMTAAEAKVWADGVRGELVRSEPPTTPEERMAQPEATARSARSVRAKDLP